MLFTAGDSDLSCCVLSCCVPRCTCDVCWALFIPFARWLLTRVQDFQRTVHHVVTFVDHDGKNCVTQVRVLPRAYILCGHLCGPWRSKFCDASPLIQWNLRSLSSTLISVRVSREWGLIPWTLLSLEQGIEQPMWTNCNKIFSRKKSYLRRKERKERKIFL